MFPITEKTRNCEELQYLRESQTPVSPASVILLLTGMIPLRYARDRKTADIWQQVTTSN